MFSESGRLSQAAAWILITINSLVMLGCVMAFAFSLWVIASPVTLHEVLRAGGQTLTALLPLPVLTVYLGLGLSAVAAVIFFISFMGFYGAITRSPFLLFMYATLAFLMLLLECSLLFYFSTSFIEKGLLEKDGQWTHLLRVAFRCCEINATDTDSPRPWSCCGIEGHAANCTSMQVFKENCNNKITAWIYRYQTAIYTFLAVLHIVLSSCSVMRRCRSASLSGS